MDEERLKTMFDDLRTQLLADLSAGLSDELLTVEEAARKLRMSRAKTYQLIKAGRLRAQKIDRSTRVAVSTINAFIAAGGAE